MSKYNFIASTTFGLEACVKREIQKLNLNITKSSDGRIDFEGDFSDMAKANIWLRTAERVLINMGEFQAFSFDELFENTKAIPWHDIIPVDGNFIVTGKSIKSTLYSVPDCQSIVEKAIVENLKKKHNVSWFDKSGAVYKVQVAILNDNVTLTIDTSGAGLHKRGYRYHSVAAPLKETLAAALIQLSFWHENRLLLDAFCGSGTIPIEAAMIAKNIAPGLKRDFVSEDWSFIDKNIWKEAKEEANSLVKRDFKPEIFGYDIDESAIELSKNNAKFAGVLSDIRFKALDFKNIELEDNYGVMISNPPYGERIGEKEEAEEIIKMLGETFKKLPSWNVYVLSPEERFERIYGKRANRKRKLFNGAMKTDYYQFFGKKPEYKKGV